MAGISLSGHQSMMGANTDTATEHLKSPINLTWMFLGGSWSTWRESMQAYGKPANST